MQFETTLIDSAEALTAKLNDQEIFIFLAGESFPFAASGIPDHPALYTALFPAIIDGVSYSATKGILLQFPANFQVHLASLNDGTIEPPLAEGFSGSLIAVVDGLSSFTQKFLQRLYENTGDRVTIVGGGAGKMSFKHETVIFRGNTGLLDAGFLLAIPKPIRIGVAHGWEKLAGPFLATATHPNTLSTINWAPAFEIYARTIHKDCGKEITAENFFEVARDYPFGMEKMNNDLVVRDPVSVTKNDLNLIGDIPENSVIYILKGRPHHLIESIGEALEEMAMDQSSNSHLFVFDCISRGLFLADHFTQEVQSLRSSLPPHGVMIGCLSFGEIANQNREYIEFYNKTCVMGAL